MGWRIPSARSRISKLTGHVKLNFPLFGKEILLTSRNDRLRCSHEQVGSINISEVTREGSVGDRYWLGGVCLLVASIPCSYQF